MKHLMGGKDAADVAAWAHKARLFFCGCGLWAVGIPRRMGCSGVQLRQVNKKYPWTTELHFQRQPNTRFSIFQLSDFQL